MRMGTSNLKDLDYPGEINLMISKIKVHPGFIPGLAYYDVGIAVSEEPITFSMHVRSICLPYLPIENADHFKGNYVTALGWMDSANSNIQASNLELKSWSVKVNTFLF